jgi:predicted  nucleic acid-binding Zn-ribbon protein
MAISKKTTTSVAAKSKIVDHSKEIKALENKVLKLEKLLEDAAKKIEALEELSKKPVKAKDVELRKTLSIWNSKLGKRIK